VDTGVRLQAQVSPELLLSIFHPRSPLHDGAVIIDGRLIVAARCVLPLSSQQRVDNRNLGTRHRAGLGISEQAAVLVIIVSEETGMISIAAQGELESDIPPADLKQLLVERLSELSVA
jgi:diadenylate cyclase